MVVTVDDLEEALVNVLELDSGGARDIALRVLNYFGFAAVIIDNVIIQEDRKVFYDLHDAGLLNTYWETVILPSGRSWRTFYWELDEASIERARQKKDEEPEEKVYESLPEDAWARIPA